MSSAQGVKGFYTGKNIFLTGGTGFLGVCLLEKILRNLPECGSIYVLMRPKKGKEISERLEEIKKNKIFEPLLKERSAESIFANVKAIAGDVGQEGLGLSPADRKLLIDNVNVIFHSAATLDFGEPLKSTVHINLLGTRAIAELAKECKKLNVLVHVSSAYVNSWRLEADEIIYPLNYDAEKLIKQAKELSEEELDSQTPAILGDHPNTYTITKHMAEHEVQKVETTVPCAIVRPSMILGCWKDPIPGWTMSKNGPPGFFMGAAKGVVRRLPVGKDLVYDYVPVDIVVNTLLTAGFHAGVSNSKKVEVYHATSSTRNPFCWASVEDRINGLLHDYPVKSAVWYPHLKLLPSIMWFKISAIFVHILPALILDQVLSLTGGRPILMRLHRNINTSLDRLEKFIFTEWKFPAPNTEKLQKWLTEKDQADFNTDLSALKWPDFFVGMVIGSRIYLNNEPMKTLAAAKSHDRILYIAHLFVQALIYSLIWFIVACVFGLTMTKAAYVLPVIYALFSLL
ncbi:unnamed protein product [Brassicogethes aeneus]|uniref:Fatty acyl-CoA reductase n=1 Tax=Brassicogethes aeneus TaxID=1431903 RepID=A0A9P0AVI4_BRAAE|nr:unnamed protein product [Brassicogethes aeneus]